MRFDGKIGKVVLDRKETDLGTFIECTLKVSFRLNEGNLIQLAELVSLQKSSVLVDIECLQPVLPMEG